MILCRAVERTDVEEDQLKGVIDLIAMKGLVWKDESKGAEYETVEIPDNLKEDAAAAREKLIEAVASVDDGLMHKYIEGEEISELLLQLVEALSLACRLPLQLGLQQAEQPLQVLELEYLELVPALLQILARSLQLLGDVCRVSGEHMLFSLPACGHELVRPRFLFPGDPPEVKHLPHQILATLQQRL